MWRSLRMITPRMARSWSLRCSRIATQGLRGPHQRRATAEVAFPKPAPVVGKQAKVKTCFCHINTHEVAFFHQTHWFWFDEAFGRAPFGHSLVNSGSKVPSFFGTAFDTVRSLERRGTRKGGLIYKPGSSDLWARQFSHLPRPSSSPLEFRPFGRLKNDKVLVEARYNGAWDQAPELRNLGSTESCR